MKPDPKAFVRMKRRLADERALSRMKTRVRQYHNYRCCVCCRPTKVVHEHLARSLRGPVSLVNSFLACDKHDGGSCHPLLQQHKIHAYNTGHPDQDPRQFDARRPITFEVPQKYAAVIFAGRTVPTCVVVTP